MSNILPVNNFKEVNITSVSPTVTSVAVSGQRQSKGFGTQYWQIQAEYASLTREQFNNVMAFLNKQRGSLFQFNVIIPQLSDSGGSYAKAAAAFPDRALILPTTSSGRFPGQTNIPFRAQLTGITRTQINAVNGDATKMLVAGDFIRFANHSKVYQILENVNNSSSTTFTNLEIFPPLFAAVPNGTQVFVHQVPFEVYNVSDSQEYKYSIGDDNSIILDLQEAL
jgi:hypothetical protein